MMVLLAAWIDVTALLALALAAVAAMRRRSAATRHALLAAAMVVALLMPALELVVPIVPVLQSWALPAASAPVVWQDEGPAAVLPAAAGAGPRAATALPFDWTTAALAVWAGGAVVMGLLLMLSVARVARLRARCRPLPAGRWREIADTVRRPSDRAVTLLEGDAATPLVACGLIRPAVLVPSTARAWPADRIRAVLVHELAHVRRHDALCQLAGEVVRVFAWFNPLVWLACRRLRQESERASDDEVLRSGVGGTEYARHLLAIAQDMGRSHTSRASAPAIAHPSHLERRVRAMLSDEQDRAPVTRTTWTAAVAGMLVIAIPLAAVGLAPAQEIPRAPAPADGVSATASIAVQAPRPVEVQAPPLAPVPPQTSMPRAPAPVPSQPVAPARPSAVPAAPQRTPPRTPELPRIVVPAPPASTAASADEVLASFSGTVQDSSGGALPGVTVRLAANGDVRATVTDGNGSFLFRNVVPSRAELVASLPGFASIHDVVALRSGDNVARVITLPLGTLEESITVVCPGGAGAAREEGIRFGARPSGSPRAVAPWGSWWTRAAQAFYPVLSAQAIRPVRVGGQVRAPQKLTDVRPRCPADLPPGETVVTMIGRIGTDGMLTGVRRVPTGTRALPPDGVADAVREALRGWAFTPALLNGQPATVDITIRVTFRGA